METLSIPNLSARTIEGLRVLAACHGRTLETEVRAILEQAARGLTEADEFLASIVTHDEPAS